MIVQQENFILNETHGGFSERDFHSKAILNKDGDSLLSYKIQRNRMYRANAAVTEIEELKKSHEALREELVGIKDILLKLTADSK